MRRTTVMVAFGLTLTLAFAVSSPAALADLPLPPPGQVWAEWLDDGTPVFVAHQPDGRVDVLGAELPLGFPGRAAIGWCPALGTFIQVMSGARFRRDGTYLGGPPPAGMPRYEADLIDGRVRVRRQLDPAPRDARSPYEHAVSLDNECYDERGGYDLDPTQVVLHDEPFADAITAEELRGVRDGVVLVRGNLVGRADGGVEFCQRVSQASPPLCVDPVAYPGDGGRDLSPYGIEGWFRVTMRDDTLERVVMAAATRPAGWALMAAPNPRVRVELENGQYLTVPAFDIEFGPGPPEPLWPGEWLIQFVNHGRLRHGLAVEPGVGLVVRPSGGYISGMGRMTLTVGDYVGYCPVPGHREAGMEFTFQVR